MNDSEYQNVFRVCRELSDKMLMIYSIKKYPEDMSRYYEVCVALDSTYAPPDIFSMGAVIERDSLEEIINMFKLGFSLNNIKNLEVKVSRNNNFHSAYVFIELTITES